MISYFQAGAAARSVFSRRTSNAQPPAIRTMNPSPSYSPVRKPGFISGKAFAFFMLGIVGLLLGRSQAWAQYYPPAVEVWSGIPNQSGAVILNGGGGSYSGGYYYTYSYETPTGYWDYSQGYWQQVDQGYWDYTQGYWDYTQGYWDTSQGHWDNSTGYWDDTQGYWDNSTGYYDDDSNWVSQPTWVSTPMWVGSPTWVVDPTWVSVPVWVTTPVWVSNMVEVWVSTPVWVENGTTTNWATAWITINLSINTSSGDNVSLSDYNGNTGMSDNWSGTYDFSNGAFGGSLPSMTAVYPDGSSWSPPPPPPNYASFGPEAVWADGSVYSWTSSSFDNSSMTSGTDSYSDGSGHTLWVSSNFSGQYNSGGTLPGGGNWNGTYSGGVFETDSGDVRALDQGGNLIVSTAPSNLPAAVRVDGASSLWKYLGGGAAYYHYAGSNPGERLTIDGSGNVLVRGRWYYGVFVGGTMWMRQEDGDVRAVALDGTLRQPDSAPAVGPPDVWVGGAVWRFAGTWTPGLASLPGTPPLNGDHYLGDNVGQSLVIDPSGSVTIANLTYSATGSYDTTTGLFSLSDDAVVVFAGDINGAFHNTQPSFGPPAITVNGTTFQFVGSVAPGSGSGSLVDNYTDGSNAHIQINASSVSYYAADGSLLWSGAYVPNSSDPASGGVFVANGGNGLYDIRASTGGADVQGSGSPQSSHPAVVRLDGDFLHFAGTTAGDNPIDYYLGSLAGEWLWIDSQGHVAFSENTSAHTFSGTGKLLGNVFLVGGGHDLRACTADNLPVVPGSQPQWGPPAVWVEGVSWSYLGTVSDDSLPVHADFYGGMNNGQILKIDSSHGVSGSYTGTFASGVFMTGSADLRSLAADGRFAPPATTPGAGHPAELRIGGLHWQYLGSAGGYDYYASDQAGQRLAMAANGAVTYSDRPDNVSGATGTYNSNGTFTQQTGGVAFNAGTINGDLDILGDVLSLGSHADDKNVAGMSIGFSDDITQPDSPASAVAFSISRSLASWSWTRADVSSPATSVPQMRLDANNRLTLFDPATSGLPAVVIDPQGGTYFTGGISIDPQGGVSMGTYTNRP